MKLRRRDSNHLFIAQGYYSLNHDGSGEGLKKFRAKVSMQTLNPQMIMLQNTGQQTKRNKIHKLQTKESRMNRNITKYQSKNGCTVNNDIRNANSFRHLTAIPYINSAQIKWALGLRNHQASMIQGNTSQAPSTYYKSTQCSKTHHEISEIPSRFNFNSFAHLDGKGQHPSMGTLKFQATLRQPEQQARRRSPGLLDKQRSFITIPLRDRHQYPKLLSSKSVKSRFINAQQDLQTAFDGDHKFPSYTDKVIKQKNYNNIRQHITKPIRAKINLPSIGWQTSLRSYIKQRRHRFKQKDSQINRKATL